MSKQASKQASLAFSITFDALLPNPFLFAYEDMPGFLEAASSGGMLTE
jgi:hypothetical protein